MAGVDSFLESVGEDYAALYRENAILKSKIKVLVEKVEEYRSTEDSMRMALLTAQKMGDDIVADANRCAAETLEHAQTQSQEQLSRLRALMDDEEERLRAAAAQTEQFVSASRELMRSHLDFLSRLEQIHKPITVSAPEPAREDHLDSAVREIDSNVEKLIGAAQAQIQGRGAAREDVAEPAAAPPQKAAAPDDLAEVDEPTTPRPKFAFDDLKFGVNFDDE
jgi:cell division initiation protein